MPRVLRIINRLNLGGPTFNAAYLSRYMAPGFETLLVSGEKDETEACSKFIVEEMGLQPVYVPEMRRALDPYKDYTAYKKIQKIIREFKPDIVHTHAAKAGALGRLAAINNKVPVVLHTFHGHFFHSYFNPVKTRMFLEIERYLARKSSAIIAISKKQKEELTEIYKVADPEKVEVIPLGFDLSKFGHDTDNKRKAFRERFRIEEDEIAIGIVGRLVPVKNHELFLRGLANVLNATDKKVRAFIIGDGEERQNIETKATELNIEYCSGCPPEESKPLTFTSWIRDIDEVNAGMDIITLTSLNEGTPVSLIEAQASSKFIVSTKVGGIEDVVLEGETALLCEVNDINGYTNNLLQVINNQNLRNSHIKKGQTHVNEKFHYTRLVKDMEDLYRRLLK